jgi:GGDEF domain-containing protein
MNETVSNSINKNDDSIDYQTNALEKRLLFKNFNNRGKYLEWHEIGFIYINIHRFHMFNQTHHHEMGYSEGDLVLKYLVRELNFLYPQADIYRIGGNEFVVVSPSHIVISPSNVSYFTLLSKYMDDEERKSYIPAESKDAQIVLKGVVQNLTIEIQDLKNSILLLNILQILFNAIEKFWEGMFQENSLVNQGKWLKISTEITVCEYSKNDGLDTVTTSQIEIKNKILK